MLGEIVLWRQTRARSAADTLVLGELVLWRYTRGMRAKDTLLLGELVIWRKLVLGKIKKR